jgi:hypothetical protein
MKMLLFGVWIGGLLMAAEIVVRALCDPMPRMSEYIQAVDDPRGYALKPDSHAVFSGLKETLPEPVQYNINMQGLREDGVAPLASLPGKLRIAAIGDSEVFGWSVNQQQTFQTLMEQMDDRLDVVNMGVPGYNAENVGCHAAIMLKRIPCHAVLYWFNPNDFFSRKSTAFLKAPGKIKSELLLRTIFYFDRCKESREKERRYSLEQVSRAKNGLLKLHRVCQDEHPPLFLVFSRPKDYEVLKNVPELKPVFVCCKVLFIDQVITTFPRSDGHLSAEGHKALAKFLYENAAQPLLAQENLLSKF